MSDDTDTPRISRPPGVPGRETPNRLIHASRADQLRLIPILAVDVLREWMGKGEVGANNEGPFVARLTHGRVGAWCAALQYAAEEEVCKKWKWTHPIPYSRKVHSARGLLKLMVSVGISVDPMDAQVGDYVCLPRPPMPYHGHAQRISKRHGAGIVSIIDGNVGSFTRTRGQVREVGPIHLMKISLVGLARYAHPS